MWNVNARQFLLLVFLRVRAVVCGLGSWYSVDYGKYIYFGCDITESIGTYNNIVMAMIDSIFN